MLRLFSILSDSLFYLWDAIITALLSLPFAFDHYRIINGTSFD